MKSLSSVILAAAALLASAAASHAETIQLKSGAVLVGEVELSESGDLLVQMRFPEAGTVTLKQGELAPRSLYDVLERRSDPKDADARLRLAELADSAGLHGLAVSDYLLVAELRPELKKEMAKRIDGVTEAIAAGILTDAKALLEDGNPSGALMYLHTLLERYGKTKAAKEADKLMRTTHERAGASSDVAQKTISESKAPKLIASIKKDLDKGDREAAKLAGHEGKSSRSDRVAEKAIRYFESAWKKIRTLPVATQDAELQALIAHLRESGKARLVKTYLLAGSIYLQRYSIPRAEEYCNKACELAPEDKSSHALHKLIIEAKIIGGSGIINY